MAVKEEPTVKDRLVSIDNGNHIIDGILEGSFSDDEDDVPLGECGVRLWGSLGCGMLLVLAVSPFFGFCMCVF